MNLKKTPLLRNERGQAVLMTALILIALLAMAGLAVDAGRFFVVRAQLAKAVDGAALAGARVLPSGQNNAQQAALGVADMNFGLGFMNTTSRNFSTQFEESEDEAKILVSGTAVLPTTLLRVVGVDQSTVTASAEAERRPLSIALVLDNSWSLDPEFTGGIDAIGYLRTAGVNFVQYFDDTMDKMSLTRFSTGTVLSFALNHNFRTPITAAISSMAPVANTNLSDGAVIGRQQLQTDTNPASFRALVYFTDGRPTALRAVYNANIGQVDAVLICDQDPNGNVSSQLFRYDQLHNYMPGVFYTRSTLPNGLPKTVQNVQATAIAKARNAASAARDDGITVYTIGLGNPNAPQWWIQPDYALLIQMANVPSGFNPITGEEIVNTYYDPSQPEGAYYFVPEAEDLLEVFDRLAQEIVLRLTE